MFRLVLVAAALCGSGAIIARQEPEPARQTPFRTGVNFVRVDVLVTDGQDAPVLDLTKDDFEIFEDGRSQQIEQFKLVEVDGREDPRNPLPSAIRSTDDEAMVANRDDVRVFAIFLDEYHIRPTTWMSVRDELIRFVRTQFRENDLVTLMTPTALVRGLSFTRDHESIVSAMREFEARGCDTMHGLNCQGAYLPPKNIFEQQYVHRGWPIVQRVRNEVTITALQGLAVRLGSLREGRKAVIFVSEGLASGTTSTLLLRDVYRDANRHNTAIYTLDPQRLTTRGGSRGRQETLRLLAEETGGRAILNTNAVAEGLSRAIRDASAYYLLGYSSTSSQNDGKFHEVKVRVKRRNVTVNARKGYWALSAADVERASNPTPVVISKAERGLEALAAADANAYLYRWVGVSQGTEDKTRVTIVWEPKSNRNRRPSDQPGRVAVTVTTGDGRVVFEDATAAQAVFSAPSGSPGHVYTFESAPGIRDVRLTVEQADGAIIDRESISIDVPDLTSSEAISTPRVFRGRTVNEFRAAVAGGTTPAARRDFLRSDRLLIRFDTRAAEVTAVLVNASGRKISDFTVSRAQVEGTHQIDLNLGGLIQGEYVIEITAGEESEFVPFRIIG
jgi:VWFA-related protein